MGSTLRGAKDPSQKGAQVYIEPPDKCPFPTDAGEVSIPIIGSENIPLFGKRMGVVHLTDMVERKGQGGVGFRQLSDAMILDVHLPDHKSDKAAR
jgi:hypothetical protein